MKEGKSEPLVVDMPFPYGHLVDLVMDRDRQYFVDHPGVKSYVREIVPGEFYPVQQPTRYIKVTYIGDGLRMREPYFGKPE